MKEIRLTSKQREQLLEMTIKLFPEYPEIIYGRKFYPSTDYLWFCGKDGELTEEIHWFEFTYTQLLDKMVRKLGYEGATDYVCMNNGIPLDNTIIDHIYKYIYPLYK